MSQPDYDGTVKGLFAEEAELLISCVLPGAKLLETLDIEMHRPPMRVDRVYRVLYRKKHHILHLEYQSTPDTDMAHRLLVYHSILWREYKIPVLTIIIYLFPVPVPVSPLQELSGKEEILTFHFKVLKLWTMDARYYVENDIKCMYTLLPMMEGADAPLLLRAIEQLIGQYNDDEASLGRRLLWLRTFLERAETLPALDKAKVRERLDVFQQLLEQSEFVQRQRAIAWEQGKAEGKAEGKVEGEIIAWRGAIVELVDIHSPRLRELALQAVARTQNAAELRSLYKKIIFVVDETAMRQALSAFPDRS